MDINKIFNIFYTIKAGNNFRPYAFQSSYLKKINVWLCLFFFNRLIKQYPPIMQPKTTTITTNTMC